MKICACIAEYNPLHNGHLKHIEYIKNTLGAEKLIVIMSGCFTQRGEISVLDKFTRAKHAIIAGADVVIELPTVFSTANAEIFATGAVSILNSLGVVDGLCFGVESGNSQEYISLAKAMNNESKEFKKALKGQLDKGISLAKAKFNALKEMGSEFNEDLINSPNNILGLEYTKALLKLNSDIKIYPMIRYGDHNDVTLKKGVTSATSIRQVLKSPKIKKLKKCVPGFVFNDLKQYPFDFEKLLISSVITTDVERFGERPDCTEGLENRIKALVKDNNSLNTLIEKVSTKRYTKTRIQRILTTNLLDITDKFVKECLSSPLYAKILAVSSSGKELIPLICTNSNIPILTRKSDSTALKRTALQCFEKDVLANDLHVLITKTKTNEHQMLII